MINKAPCDGKTAHVTLFTVAKEFVVWVGGRLSGEDIRNHVGFASQGCGVRKK